VNGIRVCILSLLASLCYAERLPVVRGRIESDTTFFGSEIVAELQSQNRSAASLQASVSNDGGFEFRDVPTGIYTLRLTSNRGAVLAEEMVDLVSYSTQLSIRLPKENIARPVSGTISVHDLQHAPPPKAFRAFAEAEREASSGHELEAVRKLQHALRMYPEYTDARCNLGVEYIRLRRYPEALEQFEKAVQAGPVSAMLYGNLAYSLAAVGRIQDAERAARHAIDLDPSYSRGHYLLGNILAKSVTPESLQRAPEAARELRLGEADLPHAHIVIATIYLAEGDRFSASEEIRQYLRSNEKSYRADAERLLAQLAHDK
jgi:tetratricopeptide (TPR) repeat protein